MSAIHSSYPVSAPASSASLPMLSEMPRLLEYRADADPDAEFIPKTVAGFMFGACALFVCLDLIEALVINRTIPFDTQLPGLIRNFAFMLGITFVGASLLLVGLKVRADHVEEQLYARHWLNSIGTGAGFAILIWAPWLFTNHGISINRFVAAAICMALITFPALAAKWTIAPHTQLARPQ